MHSTTTELDQNTELDATIALDGATELETSDTSRRVKPLGRLAGAHRVAADAGMATAEYAIATLAACGFAGLLVVILKGGQVRGLLMSIIERALSVG